MPSFAEEIKKRNPSGPLVCFVEFDTGAGRATLSGFERPWRRVVTGLGAAAVTAVSSPIVEGSKAIRVTWDRANFLTMIATTLATGVNLSNLETVRLFVRSSVTGLSMRLGLGEASAGEFLPDIAALATANVYLERSISMAAISVGSRAHVKKLRLELYGNGSAASALTYFDNLHAVKRARYANHFTAKPDVAVPNLTLDVALNGVYGHLMDNRYPMDDTGLMGEGSGLYARLIPAVDLSGYRRLTANLAVDRAPATITLAFGENNPYQHQKSTRIVTANTTVARSFSVTGILAAQRDNVNDVILFPVTTPTAIPHIQLSGNAVTFHYYDTDTPQIPYRIFYEKLADVEPITHAIGPVQAQARVANTRVTLDNHDGEFYRLRDSERIINRSCDLSLNFQDFPNDELQSIFRGIVRGDEISDEACVVELEDTLKKTLSELPPNVIQDRQYVFPTSLGAGSAVWREDEVSGWSRPHPQHHGSPIPLGFGACFVPMLLIHRGFWKGTTKFSPIISAWKFLDDSFGPAKEVVRIFRGNLAGEFHTFGTKLSSIASFGQHSLGFVANVASGLIYVSDGHTEAGGTGTGGFVIPHFAEIRGYADDADGTWTGNAGTTISNPADVTRFVLMKILGLQPDDVSLSDFDTMRTTLTHYKVSRSIAQRQAALTLLGGRASQGGLASNVFSYFFSSNVNGKLKMIAGDTAVTTAGTYKATGRHASILKGSYRVRSKPEEIITRIEVDTGYNVASASDHSFVAITDVQAEAYGGENVREPLRIAGLWLPNDVKILTVRYVGTANTATMTILGEGEDTSKAFRFTCSNTNQNFTVDLTGASGNTISKLKVTLDNKSFLTATIGNAVSSALDARFLRSVNNISIATTLAAPTLVGSIKFGYGKMLAYSYLDYYNHNRNQVSWQAPWIGFQQELGQYVDVRSLGESQTRTVKILQTRRDPRSGVVDFVAEEVSD